MSLAEETALERLDEVGVVHIEASVAGALAKSEVEAQLDAAHKYPRSIRKFLNEAITLATLDQEIAESCIYSLPRGGKPITGPSIRLAEICASAYGNLHMGARVIGAEDKEVIAQGVTWDLEKNNRVTIETRRRITGKNGNRFNDDMITVTGNAAASVALRNAIFRVIPKSYVNIVYQKAREVAVGNASTLAAKRATVMDRLQKMGAFLDRILAKVGRPSIEDITLDDLEALIGYGTAIKNGDATVDDTFPATKPIEKGSLSMSDLKPSDQKTEASKPAPATSTENLRETVCAPEEFDAIAKAAKKLKQEMPAVEAYVKYLGYQSYGELKKKDLQKVMNWLSEAKDK